MDKHKACNVGGLATTPGGLRASSACVVGPMSSLPAAQTSWRAEHLWPSAFALLRVSRLFRRKSSSTVHSSITQGNTERRLGLDLQLRESSSSSPHSCSRTSWKADPLAEGRLSMAASGSTAMPASASILWPQLTAQNPAESSTSEVNQCLATRAEQLGWGRGGQPGSRKQLSLTLLCSRELSQSLKHWGRWEGLIPAWSLATPGTPGPTANLGAQGRARSVCLCAQGNRESVKSSFPVEAHSPDPKLPSAAGTPSPSAEFPESPSSEAPSLLCVVPVGWQVPVGLRPRMSPELLHKRPAFQC